MASWFPIIKTVLLHFLIVSLITYWEKKEKCFPHSSVSKESAQSAAHLGSIPGLGRSPGEGNGNPLQYPCLENPTEDPSGLQSIGSQRVGHNSLALFLHCDFNHILVISWLFAKKNFRLHLCLFHILLLYCMTSTWHIGSYFNSY